MKDLELEMNQLKFPDSGFMDSVQRLTEKSFRFHGGPGNARFRHNFGPRTFDFDYNFEMPEPGESPQPLIEEFNEESTPGMPKEENRRMLKRESESLNDLLGDIPMDRVKSYSIRDTKDGKRIIIELKNEPFIGHHRDVIILRSPRPEGRPGQGQGPRHQMQKRIIIREGDQEKEEKPDKL